MSPRFKLLLVVAILVGFAAGVLLGEGIQRHAPPKLTAAPPRTIRVVVPESARTPEGARPQAPPRTVAPPTHATSQVVVTSEAVNLVAGFEGFVSCPYQDVTGVWTRGFGQTHNIGPRSPCISLTAGKAELKFSLETEYLWAVRALNYQFNRHETSGLLSFDYNLGAGIFVGALREDLEHGRIYAATRIMLEYDHAGGQVLAGLKTRREAEVRLILAPMPKPKPSTKSQVRAELKTVTTHRNELRVLLTIHKCRTVHGAHAYKKCPYWGHLGREDDKTIQALEKRL